jgi:ubiquinone/menaquinone biosynthesis C-methylase UbiE
MELSRFWGWRYGDFVDHLIQMTPMKPEYKILDVATGTSVIPRKIKDRLNTTTPIHGLDITPAMLKRARKIIAKEYSQDDFCLVCATALSMPYRNDVFDVVICGLATHHMDTRVMLSEMVRILRENGELAIADVGGSMFWKLPGIKFILRLIAFIYYISCENVKRAWAEATAISNIQSVDEWYDLLVEVGFKNVTITRLRSKFIWIPKPVLIRASKNTFGGENGSNK